MANVLSVVWLVVGYAATLTATLVWVALMLPGPVGRARERIETHPGRHFFMGLLVFLFTIFVAGGLITKSKGGPMQLAGFIMIAPVLAGALVGNAAFATILAERMRSATQSRALLPALAGGAACTVLGGLVPIAGWFLFAPLVGLIAAGSGFLSLFGGKRRRSKLPVAAAVPAAPPLYHPGAPAPWNGEPLSAAPAEPRAQTAVPQL